jgi:hypothetical protein
MVVTIHQPDFLPWLGFFDRWKRSDLYIVLDDVQFLRRGWHHRDKIKTANGKAWLTVPVIKKNKYNQKIREVKIDNSRLWRPKHLGLIRESYRKAVNFDKIFPELERIYEKKHNSLLTFNLELLEWVAGILNINTPKISSSEINVRERKTSRLVDICRKTNGDTYLAGLGSKDYVDEELFKDAGIKLVWQTFNHPIYPQLYGRFEEKLSVLDYLMVGDYSEF